VHHKGLPDYDLAARLVATLPVPVILSGGLRTVAEARAAYERTGAAAVMLARGSLGNPWLFEQLLGRRDGEPGTDEILDELDWVMDRAVEHLGGERAGRYLRKFYPWYLDRLGAGKQTQAALQATDSVAQARVVLAGLRSLPAAA
jgi:tRNA-dihydrouridine synthase B